MKRGGGDGDTIFCFGGRIFSFLRFRVGRRRRRRQALAGRILLGSAFEVVVVVSRYIHGWVGLLLWIGCLVVVVRRVVGGRRKVETHAAFSSKLKKLLPSGLREFCTRTA